MTRWSGTCPGNSLSSVRKNFRPGIVAPLASRGVAFGDFDNDDDVDILIMNPNEPPSLLRHDVTGANPWLKVKLESVKSNRSTIGTKAIASYGSKLQAKSVLGQSSFLSVNDRHLHFSLGASGQADLRIRWPNGNTETLGRVVADQLVIIREGSGIVKSKPWSKGLSRSASSWKL